MSDSSVELLRGGRFRVPQALYHGVPPGWSRPELLATHARLGGSFALAQSAESSETVAGNAHTAWLQYMATLADVAEGVRAGDGACIELAVRYLELRHIGSYSGYLRQRLVRRLRQVELTQSQITRLNRHFLELVERGDFSQEFREYLRLWRRILTPEARIALRPLLSRHGEDPRWRWLPDLLTDRPDSLTTSPETES